MKVFLWIVEWCVYIVVSYGTVLNRSRGSLICSHKISGGLLVSGGVYVIVCLNQLKRG